MNETLKAKISDMEESLVKTFEFSLMYGDADQLDSRKSKLLRINENIQNVRIRAMCCEQALEEAKQLSTINELTDAYESYMKKKKSVHPKKTSEYKAFQARLQQIEQTYTNTTNEDTDGASNQFESDEIVMESQINIIDPLTKQQIENPVKNTICGHNYDKASILEAIRINRRLRCPVAGCGNKQFVVSSHLEDDDRLKLYIMNLNNQGSDDEDPLAT